MNTSLQDLKDAVTKAQKALDNWEVDTDSQEVIDMYDSMIDESGPVIICGLHYCASNILEKVDPTAYHCGMSDFADSLDKEEFAEYRELVEVLENAEAALEDAENN